MDKQTRFFTHVNKNGPMPAHCPERGPCWLWTAAITPKGYAQCDLKSHGDQRGHRVSWRFVNGEIPNRLYVLHHCDVRHCVNPDHLLSWYSARQYAGLCY